MHASRGSYSESLELIREITVESHSSVSICRDNSGRWVVCKRYSEEDRLKAEVHGLETLAKSKTVDVPEILSLSDSLLVLEYIETSPAKPQAWFDCGQTIATLHSYTGDYCGLSRDNYIGASPQKNHAPGEIAKDWSAFFWDYRLLHHLELLERSERDTARLRKLLLSKEGAIRESLAQFRSPPSLLHGDLWSGNVLFRSLGGAVLIDPSIYYGDPESDLAMTELFGGFPRGFYEGYYSVRPKKEGYEHRALVYQLYHLLNHWLIFGNSYRRDCERVINLL